MATTSLWHIKGNLWDLIQYVENPQKTAPEGMSDFFQVIDYIQRPEKTADGAFITTIYCLRETALQQMILTKERYGKEVKYIAWHGYQSFKPGEVTSELCHEIGVKLAKEMWGDRFQIIVTTHLDKGHLHNHFCVNSVSFLNEKSITIPKRNNAVCVKFQRDSGLAWTEAAALSICWPRAIKWPSSLLLLWKICHTRTV